MSEDLLTQLLIVVVQVVVSVVGGFLINYLRAKAGTENFNRYYNLVRTIVMSVEQNFGPGNGPDKKEEAVQIIKNLVGSKLTEQQIQSFIEAGVFEMNRVLKSNGL